MLCALPWTQRIIQRNSLMSAYILNWCETSYLYTCVSSLFYLKIKTKHMKNHFSISLSLCVVFAQFFRFYAVKLFLTIFRDLISSRHIYFYYIIAMTYTFVIDSSVQHDVDKGIAQSSTAYVNGEKKKKRSDSTKKKTNSVSDRKKNGESFGIKQQNTRKHFIAMLVHVAPVLYTLGIGS